MLKTAFIFKGPNLDNEFRRIISEQLTSARLALSNVDLLRQSGVHEARKCLKRLRACYQLLKAENNVKFKKFNRNCKAAGAQLAALRDSQVVLKTFEAVCDSEPRLVYQSSTSHLYNQLHKQAEQEQHKREEYIARACHLLENCQRDIDAYHGELINRQRLLKGLRKTYSQCRKTLKAARKSKREEDFHQWRKVVKYHMYHTQLLGQMNASSKQRIALLDELTEKLGDYHDLCVLKQRSSAAKLANSQFLAIIAEQQKTHLKEAKGWADTLFSDPPIDYIKKLGTYYKT